MGIMHLWAIFGGVLAVGLPLAVHWLTRPRPRRMNLSTIKFVEQAVKQRRSRHRLRDALILGARMVAVICLALAFARPLVHAGTPAEAAVERVVVLDTSASMGAVAHGVPALERARGVAARYLESASGLKANLVVAGLKPHAVFEHPSTNLAALREELGKARVAPERLDLAATLATVGDMFERRAGESPRREVVIISDLQRRNWGAVDFAALPADCQIIIESVAPAEALANLAITDVSVTGAGGGRPSAGQPGQVEVQVANYGPAARTVDVEVGLAGQTLHLQKVCPANVITHMNGEIALARQGVNAGEARLVGVEDALSADNRRAFVADVHAAAVYLLVSRDATDPQPTSSHFLERGLVPGAGPAAAGRPATGERVVRIGAAGLDQQTLAEADAVVLDHPGRLEGSTVALLCNWLRRGKSILYVAAEAADATNLGALALQAGPDLRMPVEFIPAALSATGSASAGGAGLRRDLTLVEVRRTDPLWAVFGDALQPTLEALRFAARLTSRPLEGGLADDVVATYSDRSAGLVIAPCGQGTLIVWNADLAESNIVKSGAFVPLVSELAARLRGAQRLQASEGGEPLAITLPADVGPAAEVTVEPPAPSEEEKGRLAEERGGMVWRLAAARQAGVYRLTRGGQVLAAQAVAISTEEADLATLPAELLQGKLSGGRQITVRSASAGREGPDRAWVWLAGGAFLALLAELVSLRIFKT